MDFQFIGICFAALVVFCFIIAISIFIHRIKKTQTEYDDRQERIKTDVNFEFEEKEVSAVVVDMICSTRVTGQKNVKSVEEFFICFQAEDDKIFKLKVLKEMYDGFEIGLKGKLKMVENEFYGFEPLK